MKIKTALILCAGLGKRLAPLTLETPKPLLKLNDKTILESCINTVIKLGINKIFLNTFHLGEKVSNFIKNQSFPVDIQIIKDGDEILNTGGGILNMINHSDDNDFLVFNPDTIWNENYNKYILEMADFYSKKKINNILLVVHKDLSFDKSLQGDFSLINNKLTKDNNKKFIYTGCQIINKNVFSKTTNKKFSMNEIWSNQIKKSQLFGYESNLEFLHTTDLMIYNKILKNQ